MTGPGVAEFVLARAAEREAPAQEAVHLAQIHLNGADAAEVDVTLTWQWVMQANYSNGGHGSSFVPGVPTPRRVLAEVAATRAIVALHHTSQTRERMAELGYSDVGRDPMCSSRDYPEISDDCETLLNLAALDATHPDYDPRWAL